MVFAYRAIFLTVLISAFVAAGMLDTVAMAEGVMP